MYKKFAFAIACISFAILASAAPTPKQFGSLPTVFDASISPDAKRLAIIYKFNDSYGVRLINFDNVGEEPRGILLSEDTKPNWIRWANNDRVLTALWRSEEIRGVPITSSFIYTLDANNLKGKYLVKPRKTFRQNNSNVIDFLDSDPDHILMGYSKLDQKIVDIRRVNVATGSDERIERGRKSIQRWYTDHRGEPRIGQGLRSGTAKTEEWHLTLRDVDDANWRGVEEFPGLEPDIDIFGFTNDPNELVVGRYADKDTLGLYVYDLTKKQFTRKLFHHDKYDASGLVVNSQTSEIIGARYIANSSEVELFDEYDTLMDRMRNKFPDYTVHYIDQSDDARVLVFKISNSHEPGLLLMVDRASSDKPVIIMKYRPELRPETMGGVVPVSYVARDGEIIPAYMTVPPGINSTDKIQALPFIVLPHGGPTARTSQHFDYFAQFFATRGYGVLQMNFRGSSGYGKSFAESGRENWVVMQEDVTDGAKWLVRKGYADPERMCIAGWSYGGYAALMGAIKNPELYACAISMAGVTDLHDMVRDLKRYRFGELVAKKSILDGFDSKQDLRENSPVRRAKELKVPLFLAHGTSDRRVHYDQFTRMRSALRKVSVPVTLVKFENEDHFLSQQKNRQEFFVKLDRFLNETIGESEFAK